MNAGFPADLEEVRMERMDKGWFRALTLGAVAALALSACGGSTATSTAPPATQAPGATTQPSTAAATAGPKSGGTVYLLTQADQFDQIDPQRAYTGEDLAFFSATIYRSLTAFTYSPDNPTASKLSPDLATDLGTPTDGAKTWTFTLRDGVTFQDGSPITCADIKYGVSRTFATSVINQGPTYAIAYLDIPSVDGYIKDATGAAKKSSGSAYGGPYTSTLGLFSDNTLKTAIANDTAAFDKAITCSADGKTITFHLKLAVADFNYTVTLGFSPVPKAADTGESYGVAKPPVASGPYMVQSYTTGKGGKMILVRNPKWNQASDSYHHPYPDQWEVDFGIDPKVIDQRLIQSTGNDAFAMQYGAMQPENLATVFTDPKTVNPQFAGRADSSYDIYDRYLWVNVQKVSNLQIRQAMAVALDRSALRKNAGGDFYGDYADGSIKPNIGADYAPTGFWDTLLGQKIPDTGDPTYAKSLIAKSGVAAPTLTYSYPDTPVNAKAAAIVQASLQLAGFTVKLQPLPSGSYYSTVFDPAKSGDFGTGGWGPDWPNASTVIPPLFTQEGGWDLSQVDDAAFNAEVKAAQTETDRAKQSTLWQALNVETMKNVWVIPTFFPLAQGMMGSKLATETGPTGSLYRWGPYGSNPYGDFYVKQ
jgi:peptide/nickel transport system substrate-binding protein